MSRYRERENGVAEEVFIRKQRFKRVIFYRYHQHLGRNQSQYFSLRDFDLSKKNVKGPLGNTYNVQYQGKSCVLKEISKTQMKNYGVTKHMIYQTTLAKRLKHPFLLKLYAVFEDDESMYFICERCITNYANVMKSTCMTRSKTKFSIDQIRRTAVQILLLLEYFHSKKTVLKGIHPANVFINSDGFIRFQEPGVFNTSIRKFLYWMPPEHLKNGKFTKESDLWTFGVFIYWMLTNGNIPYPRIYTVHMLLMKMRLNKIKWPKMDKKVDPLAKDFVCKLLAFRPKGRLGSGKKGIQKLKNHKFIREELESVQKEILRNQFVEMAAKDLKERCMSLFEIEVMRGNFLIQLNKRGCGVVHDDDTRPKKKKEEDETCRYIEKRVHQCNIFCNSSIFNKRKEKERLKLLGYDGSEEEEIDEDQHQSHQNKEQLEGGGGSGMNSFCNTNNEIRIWKSILMHL